MTTPADKLPPDAVPYWRAGLRTDDAMTAARVARQCVQEQRNAVLLAAVAAGMPTAQAARVLGISASHARRIARG